MAAVSAQTLFQFTRELKTLEKILSSQGFWPQYCLEYGWSKRFAVPECCFCNTPFSAIHHHMKIYGEYGVGMSRQWGISKGLSPLMYHLRDSRMGKNFRRLLQNAKRQKNEEVIYRQLVLMKPYQAVNYIKDEKGELKQHNNYLYYDEREWRYIPDLPIYKDLLRFVKDQSELDVLKETKGLDDSTKAFMCTFTAYDVKYLIVKDAIDRILLASSIENMDSWNENDKELLKSKIITCELINNDL